MTTQETLTPVRIERDVAVPVEQVWRAWTDPARLTRWFCPNPGLDTTAELDVRPGGAWLVTMGSYVVRGRYVEVDPPRLLSFTWAFEGSSDGAPSLVRVELEPMGGGTRVVLTHSEHASQEDRDGTAEGWGLSLDRLGGAVG